MYKRQEEIETKFEESGDKRAWEYQLLHRKVDSGEKADVYKRQVLSICRFRLLYRGV